MDRTPEVHGPFSEWNIQQMLSALDMTVLNLCLARGMLRAYLAQQRELAAARKVCEAAERRLAETLGGVESDLTLSEAVTAYRAVRAAEAHRSSRAPRVAPASRDDDAHGRIPILPTPQAVDVQPDGPIGPPRRVGAAAGRGQR